MASEKWFDKAHHGVMRGLCIVLVLGFCGVVSPAANAAIYNHNGNWVDIDYWAGSGSNEAVVVVDFYATGGDSYAFGFKWDGVATGYDALVAIDAAGALDFEATYWVDWGGYFTDNFNYNGESGNQSYYWQYFTSSDGGVWDPSMAGMSDRILTDGDWDGWYNGFDPGVSPTTPVPEPMTIVLLGLGGLFLRKRTA